MSTARTTTGVNGLDEILAGGLPSHYTYLLMGGPGTGKTTLSLQFLLEGIRQGENVLYITLLQTELGIREMAATHGWDLSGIHIKVLTKEAEKESDIAEQTLLPTAEIQLDDVISAIEQAVDKYRPTRLVFDSIEQVRLLAGDPVIYRQKVLATQRLLAKHKVTTIFVESSVQTPEFKTLVHGVIQLENVVPHFGAMHRNILVEKMRGVDFSTGFHSFRIRTGGIEVFPRLPIAKKIMHPSWSEMKSGIESLEKMLGGGLTTGTACLLAGESGTGKSSVATVYVHAAAERGEKSAVFLFDERHDTFFERAANLGYDMLPYVENGTVTVNQVSIGDISAGELAHNLRKMVEEQNIKIVVLDSLTGFYQTLPEKQQLLLVQLHEMLAYLGQQGVLTLMILTEHNILAPNHRNIDASFISDTVVILRRFEAVGAVRIAVSAVKKRHGDHDKYIRELQLTTDGVVVGEPLHEFRGILTGFPQYTGKPGRLLDED